ncbi:MAG: hypothetical protein ACREBU_07370 [Nitrososphaera sp.]
MHVAIVNYRSTPAYSATMLLTLLIFSHMLSSPAYASTDYSLKLFEGSEPSDGVVGLNQEVRASLIVEILIDITVETDKDKYTSGDMITIFGKVNPVADGQPVLILVKDPKGALARVDPVSVDVTGAYTYSFPSGGPLMVNAGEYTVEVFYRG